jgi:dihydroneopterin aldolase
LGSFPEYKAVSALPGYDEEQPNEDFTSVEKIADDLAEWLIARVIAVIFISLKSKRDESMKENAYEDFSLWGRCARV